MTSWLALSAALGGIAYFAAWSRYPTKARGLTVAAFALSLPISGALILHARGWSAPVVPYLVTIPEGELDVLGAKMVPEVAIYIWLDVGGSPRAFELPWDAKTASELQRALEDGNGVKAKRPKGNADDEEYPMIFYPNPQPAAPEKQPEAPGFTYQFPEGGQ